MLLTLTSGAYFPIEYFPPWLQAIAEINPMTQVLNGAREALLGIRTGPWYGASYPLSFPLRSSRSRSESLAFRMALTRERRRGTLGLY